MAQDVQVKAVGCLEAYNKQVKTFNTSVDVLIAEFRRKIEKTMEEYRDRLSTMERRYESSMERVNNQSRKLNDFLERNNWHQLSRMEIEREIDRVNQIGSNLTSKMEAMRQRYATLSAQLSALSQQAVTFSQSNHTLLTNSVNRMDKTIQFLNQYKETTVK